MQGTPSVLRYSLDKGIAHKPRLKGLDAWVHASKGLATRLTFHKRRFFQRVQKVLQLENEYKHITNAELIEAADGLRDRFRLQRDTDEDLERAFALIREVAYRQIGEKPYPVQVMGAFALNHGCVAEMATGEGKTLTATLPATVAGWRGRGCHIITVNDYLAERDAQWMGQIYRRCGLRAAFIQQGMDPKSRQYAYQADITYCTNKEVTADFLRDRLLLGPIKNANKALLARMNHSNPSVWDRVVQRGLHCAIVDEADSVMIDEAATPLIISGSSANEDLVEAYYIASEMADSLEAGSHYTMNQPHKEIEFTAQGRAALAQRSTGLSGLCSAPRQREEIVNKALVARRFYRKDKQYVVKDGKVIIVDDFTGRLMPDRSWREGLHQAIEAKEGLELTAVKETHARLSFQRFFRLYHKLAGMTGTAQEVRREFWQVYQLPVVVIPPNKPCRRDDWPEIIVRTQQEKWQAICDEVKHLHRKKRPVLIGTRSIEASKHLSRLLTEQHLDHQVLNAEEHEKEARIIKLAGQPKRITVATNMAGRGTDIKLTRKVEELGGLHVICAERNESRRIDRQLLGRCARQGKPGSTRTIVSLEDELIRQQVGYLADVYKNRDGRGEGENIAGPFTRSLFQIAQARTQSQSLRQRKNVMKADHWLDEHLSFAAEL